VLFATALAIRVLVAWIWRFDGLYGQDAFAYYGQAEEIAARFSEGHWSLPEYFWPSGFPIFAALAMMVFGAAPTTAQALNMVLGSAVVVLVYLVARDLLDDGPGGGDDLPGGDAEKVGIVAASATMVAGQLIFSSVVVMADMAAAFWLALSAWLLVRFVRSPGSWFLMTGAAAAGAAAVVTRWAMVLVAPAFAVVAAMTLGRCARRRLAVLTAFLAAGIVALPQLMLSLSGKDGGLAGYFADWSPLNVFMSSYESDEGLTRYRFPNGVFYLAPWWHPALMPPTMGAFALPGVIALWIRRRVRTLLFLGLWIAAPFVFFVGIPHQNLRYGITLWVPAVILAAVGVLELWRRPARRWLVVCLLLVSLVGSVLWNGSRWSRFFASQHQVKEMARHLDEALPRDAVILSFEVTGILDHYTTVEVRELFSMDTGDLRSCTDRNDRVWVVVDVDTIETQWKGLSPWRNLMWLRTNRSLTAVEDHGQWTVFSVGRPDTGEWSAESP
jgi:4-amino-4-deoxy-L-arabinose transferase-like glycosyltransferase